MHLGKAKPAYGEPGFVDPMLFDTSLTPAGARGAKAAAQRAARLSPKPEVRGVRRSPCGSQPERRGRAPAPCHCQALGGASTSHSGEHSAGGRPWLSRLHGPSAMPPSFLTLPFPPSGPQLLVVSPLTRALKTAQLAFGEAPPCPVVVEPLFR